MDKLTADTITDEQIRELRAAEVDNARRTTGADKEYHRRNVGYCDDALANRTLGCARCAGILNARAEGK